MGVATIRLSEALRARGKYLPTPTIHLGTFLSPFGTLDVRFYSGRRVPRRGVSRRAFTLLVNNVLETLLRHCEVAYAAVAISGFLPDQCSEIAASACSLAKTVLGKPLTSLRGRVTTVAISKPITWKGIEIAALRSRRLSRGINLLEGKLAKDVN